MYSPKVREDLIPALYRLGRARGRPMTQLVSEAVERYLAAAAAAHPDVSDVDVDIEPETQTTPGAQEGAGADRSE